MLQGFLSNAKNYRRSISINREQLSPLETPKTTVSPHPLVIQISECHCGRASQGYRALSQPWLIQYQKTDSQMGTTVPRYISYRLPDCYVCCLKFQFSYLSYSCLISHSCFDTYHLGFISVISGYVQHFPGHEEVGFLLIS